MEVQCDLNRTVRGASGRREVIAEMCAEWLVSIYGYVNSCSASLINLTTKSIKLRMFSPSFQKDNNNNKKPNNLTS